MATAAKLLFDVNRGAFVPPPSVTSSIVRLEPRAQPLAPCALSDLEKITAASFGQRRKMLRQSLKALGGEALAEKAGIDPTARPEDLTIEQFAALARWLPDQPKMLRSRAVERAAGLVRMEASSTAR